jgi:Domain of unknown function (DUF6378)
VNKGISVNQILNPVNDDCCSGTRACNKTPEACYKPDPHEAQLKKINGNLRVDDLVVQEFSSGVMKHLGAEPEFESPKVLHPIENRSILREADQVAGTDRSRDYGHPYENHRRIAAMWNVRLEGKLKEHITPGEVTEMMILLKCARLMNSYTRDSVLDIAGYAKCRDMIAEHTEKAQNGV